MKKFCCTREATWNLDLSWDHRTFTYLTYSSPSPPYRSPTWNILISRYVNPQVTHNTDADDINWHHSDVTAHRASLSVYPTVIFPPSKSIYSCDNHSRIAFLFHTLLLAPQQTFKMNFTVIPLPAQLYITFHWFSGTCSLYSDQCHAYAHIHIQTPTLHHNYTDIKKKPT